MPEPLLIALSDANANANAYALLARAAAYLPDDRSPIILAHVIDERAIEEYDLASRNLLQGHGRVEHFETAMLDAAEHAAQTFLAEARDALLELRPALTAETVLLYGIPGEALVAAAAGRGAGGIALARGTAETRTIEATGAIVAWHRNRHGDLDGFTLSDGIDVRVPPHRGEALAADLPAGRSVTVSGEPRRDHLHAWSVRDEAGGTLHPAHEPKAPPLGPIARYVVDHAPCDVILLQVPAA